MKIFLSLLFMFLATVTRAETFITSDIDGDGHAESFELIGADIDALDDGADLLIRSRATTIRARDIAWVGGLYGQLPMLARAPNGSILLTSMNASVGRDRWELTLTIAYRSGAYRIAGYTYHWRDTLNPDAFGSCDLNLLTGRGTLTTPNQKNKPVRTVLSAPRVEEWSAYAPLPAACDPDLS